MSQCHLVAITRAALVENLGRTVSSIILRYGMPTVLNVYLRMLKHITLQVKSVKINIGKPAY